jgi:hypothetical protein
MIRAFLAGAAVFVFPTVTLAAELTFSAPDGCQLEATLRGDAERLIGAPLRDVRGMNFEIRISGSDAESWKLRLVTIERSTGKQRLRELRGASCAEVADAGAVALALAVQQPSEVEGVPSDPEEDAPSNSAASSAVVTTDAPNDQVPAPVLEPQTDRPRPPESSESATFAVSASMMVDSGALPALAPGAEIALVLRYLRWRFAATGTWLAPQHRDIDAERGGDFQLIAAGALACREAAPARVVPMICSGFEIGRLEGEGTGVTRSKLGTALWEAVRVEGGATARFGGWGAEGRAGIAVPVERREFVLDQTDFVHRPDGLSARLYLGLISTF